MIRVERINKYSYLGIYPIRCKLNNNSGPRSYTTAVTEKNKNNIHLTCVLSKDPRIYEYLGYGGTL